MTAFFIALAIHLIMVIAAVSVCVKYHETEKVLAFALCCIPYIGPAIIILASYYFVAFSPKDDNTK